MLPAAMSEKVMRCRQELSAAIRRALENIHRPTTDLPNKRPPDQDRSSPGSNDRLCSCPRRPSIKDAKRENAKEVAPTRQGPETDKGGNIHDGNSVVKKENALLPTGAGSPKERSEHRDRLEEPPADLIPPDTARDLNDIIDQTSPTLILQLSRLSDCEIYANMDRDLIFGPGSFLSLISNDKEHPTGEHNNLETTMADLKMEGALSLEDNSTEPKDYYIL